MKIALQDIPPLSMRTISSAFGALTLFCVCAVSRRNLRIASAKNWGHVFCHRPTQYRLLRHSQCVCPNHRRYDSRDHPRLHNADLGSLASMGGAARAAKCKTGACHCPVRTRACGVDLSIGERRRALRPVAGCGSGDDVGRRNRLRQMDPLGASLGSHILAACDRVPCDCGLSHCCRWPVHMRTPVRCWRLRSPVFSAAALPTQCGLRSYGDCRRQPLRSASSVLP